MSLNKGTPIRDDIRLSDEHSEFVFAPFEKIKELENLAPYYKEAIMKCANSYYIHENKIPKIKVVIR